MGFYEVAVHVAEQFSEDRILRVEPLGHGLVNDTFLVVTAASRFVLQRINPQVFPDPVSIMDNLRTLSDHLGGHRAGSGKNFGLRLPEIVPVRAGGDFHRDGEGGCWRALSFIEGTRSLHSLTEPAHAEAVGYALGRFHALVSDLDPTLLRDTLPGFHIAPDYLAQFDRVAARPRRGSATADLRYAMRFVAVRRTAVDVLEEAKQSGNLKVRVIHGDPKLDNVLFDAITGRVVSLIDLDTVKPGLIHYDVGDCLRSCCNQTGENGGDSKVVFDLDLCRAILGGYLPEAREFLTAADREHFYDAIRLLPFELGLRFLTDHLAGDVYFRVDTPGQNLHRALVQFQLTESVEEQKPAILEALRELI